MKPLSTPSQLKENTPGPDGIKGEWYRMYAPTLAPKLHSLYADYFERMMLPPSMHQAHIVLIPKPGKDHSKCISCRPISLLNYDLKILTKILATRLMKVIPNLLSIEQTGFIPGKSTDINIRRVFTHLQLPSIDSTSRVLATLVIEKAFDSIAWPYMHAVLESMGFRPVFLKWVQLLYLSLKVQIQVGVSSQNASQ